MHTYLADGRAGTGPFSETVSLAVEPDLLLLPGLEEEGEEHPLHLQQTWFVSFIGTFSILVILASAVLVYLKRRKTVAKQFNQYSGQP
jgi:hypothetical protein